MQEWQVTSNLETFGVYETARIMRKRKISFADAYAMIFGRPARIL